MRKFSTLRHNQVVFKEIFQEETFTPANITHMEKKSFEEIINFSKPNSFKNMGVFLFNLKEKFYPFKSRLERDKIFKQLVRPHSLLEIVNSYYWMIEQ